MTTSAQTVETITKLAIKTVMGKEMLYRDLVTIQKHRVDQLVAFGLTLVGKPL